MGSSCLPRILITNGPNSCFFYDGVVVPGALLLMASGTWLIVQYHGGWAFLDVPWLAGMVALFTFEFIEGNTITRLYFMRIRRLTQIALAKGAFTPELAAARAEGLPTFTHFLDLPLLFLIIALGVMQPGSWSVFFYGCAIVPLVASVLTVLIPRLCPWREKAAKSG